MAGLLAEFDRNLARPDRDLVRDGVGYRQIGLWLDDDEFAGLVTDLRAVLAARAANGPGSGRRRRILSTVLLPADQVE